MDKIKSTKFKNTDFIVNQMICLSFLKKKLKNSIL